MVPRLPSSAAASAHRLNCSAAYLLLFVGQRSPNCPGLPVWSQLAYETEYYVFDPARPVIRFHLGRPLESGIQYTDYSLADETKAPQLGNRDHDLRLRVAPDQKTGHATTRESQSESDLSAHAFQWSSSVSVSR